MEGARCGIFETPWSKNTTVLALRELLSGLLLAETIQFWGINDSQTCCEQVEEVVE